MDPQISIGGVDVSEDVISAVFTESNAGGETLAVTLSRSLDDAAFSDFATVVLQTDERTWTGTLMTEPAQGSGSGETISITARGIWWRWENIIYKQQIQIGPSDEPTYSSSAAFMLGRVYDTETDEAERISGQAQFVLLTNFLTAQGLTFTVTGTFPDLQLPWIPRSNASVASLVQTLLTWFPAYALIFPNGVDPVLVDVDSTDLRAISELGLNIEDVTINPRYDLLATSTKIIYLSRALDSNGREYISGTTEDLSTTGGLSSPVTLELPVELEVGEAAPATGLAAQFQRWRGRLQLESRIQTVGDLKWTWKPGDRIQLGSALDRYATDEAVIQQITRDLMTDTLTLDVGPRNHLGLDQLLQLVRKPPKDQRDKDNSPPAAPPTGTLTITIAKDADELDLADCYWTAVGPESYKGNGEGTETVQQGNYSVVFHPVFNVAEGLAFWPEFPVVEVTVGSGGGTANGSYGAVQRAFVKASNQEDPTGFDLNAQDIVDMGVATGKALLKARQLDVCHNGAPGKRIFLCSESFDPAA
jgi:hypothetical protein